MKQGNESRPAVSHEATGVGANRQFHSTADKTPVFCVLVRRELASGGTRTSLFRTIAPAERAVERAAKQGLQATVEFMRLVPVDTGTSEQLADLERGARIDREVAEVALAMLADPDVTPANQEHCINTLRVHLSGGDVA